MASTRDIALDTRLFSLFKGDPGSGKSIAAASYPGHRTKKEIGPYFFDNDGRMKAVVNYWRPRGREFEYDHFTDFDDMSEKLDQFVIDCPYQTLVFDSVTTGSDAILGQMLRTRNPATKKIKRGEIELYQIDDYGGEMRGLLTIIEKLKALSYLHKINVIVTAHVISVETQNIVKQTTTVSRQLMTAGKKVAAALPVHFDEAYHFDVIPSLEQNSKPQFTAVTYNTGLDWAKTALPLPVRLNFTDASFYDRMMAHLSGYEFVHAANEVLVERADGSTIDINQHLDVSKPSTSW